MSNVKDLAREIAAERHLLDGSLEDGELGLPEDVGEATKYARWLRGVLRERDRTLAPFDDEIEMLQAARDDLAAGYERRIEQLEQLLTGWHQAVLHDEPDRKTIKLPYVTLSARESKGRFVIDDKDALEVWALENAPQLLREVRELRPGSDLRAMMHEREDGTLIRGVLGEDKGAEVVPGVRVEGAGVSYTVKPS